MKKNLLWRISIVTLPEAEDAVVELLGSLFENPASAYHQFETGLSTVSVFSEKKFSTAKIRKEILAGLQRIKNSGLEIGAGKIAIAKMKREDWAESWKKHFHALEIGDSLLIKPSWIKKHPRKNQKVVILDPGLSFGTGQHPTTSFCLNEIVRHKNPCDASFLDIGTGSGILAIAAAKLGYQFIYAFDFDPESIRVAKDNAESNQVVDQIKIRRDDVTKLLLKPRKQFDLVCANLISNLLVAQRKKIVAQMKRSGTLVLAGILASEFTEVQNAFEVLGLKLVANKVENEWCSGAFRFR